MKNPKITGIKKIAGQTQKLTGWYGHAMVIMYDTATGKAWADEFVDGNSWVDYHSPDIINCGKTYFPMTMVEIRDMIEGAVSWREKELALY